MLTTNLAVLYATERTHSEEANLTETCLAFLLARQCLTDSLHALVNHRALTVHCAFNSTLGLLVKLTCLEVTPAAWLLLST